MHVFWNYYKDLAYGGPTWSGLVHVISFPWLTHNRDVALRFGLNPPSLLQTLPKVRLSTKVRGLYRCLFINLERHSQQLLHGTQSILCTHFLRRRTFCVKPVSYLSVY
jgi:hypothetical protein